LYPTTNGLLKGLSWPEVVKNTYPVRGLFDFGMTGSGRFSPLPTATTLMDHKDIERQVTGLTRSFRD
jgi:hypothetical protein